ncbi:hypothetical protein L7F22_061612 [Adiantum nelumboides]|nr:hypothetical protein [Adiantum nelumboides]
MDCDNAKLCRFLSTTTILDDSQEALASLHAFDKAGIVAAHLQLQARVRAMPSEAKSQRAVLQQSLQLIQHDPFLKPASLAPAASDQSLTLTTLADLRVGEWHNGKYLRGFLSVDAPLLQYVKFLVSVFVEDSCSTAARLVMSELFHDLISQVPPPGSQIIIKEPCLVRDHFGRATYIWMSNPASLEVVAFYLSADLALKTQISSVALRELGNKEHSKGNFPAAVALYSRSADTAQEKEEKVLALSNRAESWLNLEFFDKSLADAESALEIDASHAKSIFRKVRALWKMHRYQSAFKFMKEQMELLPPDVADRLQNVYKDALVFKEQSVLGNHDLSEFFKGGCEAAPPQLAEFVGPVTIGLSSTCGGRGLFLTSDVSAGDLLMAINAFAEVKVRIDKWKSLSDDVERVKPKLLAEVIRACLAAPRNLSKLYAEHEGQLVKPAPSISLFKPIPDTLGSEEDMTELPLLDVSRLLSIVSTALDTETRLFDETDLIGGLWLLVAFINHSCIPNVCVRRIGSAKIVIASRDMKAGTELHRTYGSTLLPFFSRIESFVCPCLRCHFERQLMPQVEQLAKRYVKLFFEKPTSENLQRLRNLELSKVAMEVEKFIRSLKLGGEEIKWLRTAFGEAYVAAHSLQFVQTPATLPRAEDIVEAMFETAAGALDVLKWVFYLSKMKVLNARCVKLINRHFKAYFGHQTDSVIMELKVKEGQGCRKIWVR